MLKWCGDDKILTLKPLNFHEEALGKIMTYFIVYIPTYIYRYRRTLTTLIQNQKSVQ